MSSIAMGNSKSAFGGSQNLEKGESIFYIYSSLWKARSTFVCPVHNFPASLHEFNTYW